jgi:hypothetical protein
VDDGARAVANTAASRELQRDHARGRPAHGLRGGALPKHRRVLGTRHRHLPDPGRRLHARLPLLRRHLGPARGRPEPLEPLRVATAVAGWGCATWSSPRSTATTCPIAAPATSPPPSAPSAARTRVRRRGAGARLPGLPREALRTVLAAGAGRLQPQHRDGRAVLPAVRPKGDYRKALDLLDRAKDVWAELSPGAAAAADQERHHRGDGRDRRGRGRDHARSARPPRRRGHDRPVPAAERRATCRSTAG